MPSLRDVSDAAAGMCTPVPATAAGICDVCHGCVPNPAYRTCYSCNRVIQGVSRPSRRIVPVSLMTKQGQLYDTLRRYKAGWVTPAMQAQHSVRVVGLLGRFLEDHAACIAAAGGGMWDVITIVPSSSGRPGPHPLASALGRYQPLFSQYVELLRPGAAPLGHNQASNSGYALATPVQGRRVLLLDDTFTTGARVQSAASALQDGGAVVVAVVPVGRLIDPDYTAEHGAYWRARRLTPFDFATCCLCRL